MKHRHYLYGLLPALLIAACTGDSIPQPDPSVYADEIRNWDDQRIKELKDKEGWLNLAGLFWLKQGENTVGSDTTCDIVFPGERTPSHIGTFLVDSQSVTLVVHKGIRVTGNSLEVKELSMTPGNQAIVAEMDSLVWFIIQRGDKFAVRLRDLDHPNISRLDTIERYPLNLEWRVKARFVPFEKPRKVMFPTIIGVEQEVTCPGMLEFKHKGKKYSLLPTGSMTPYFIVFADATSAIDTYGGGRFLMTEALPDGTLVLDFNKAHNPPCAFTPFATCPLPVKENYLPFPVTAGEKKVKQFEYH